jgi:flagellar biosynthesis/type III secretory pathway chaperone
MSDTLVVKLAEILSQEQSTVDQLKQVLQQESVALSHHDIKTIESSASHKKRLLNTFSKQVNARLRFLSTQKHEASEQGLSLLLSTLPEDTQAPLTKQWKKLKEDFQTLLRENERNGLIIHHSQLRNRNLLNILHGNKNQPNLYNESGAAQGHLNSKTIGEA